MLERQIERGRGRRLRRGTAAAALSVGAGVAVWCAIASPRAPVVIVTPLVPAAQVRVELPPARPAAPPIVLRPAPPAAPAPVIPTTIGVRCADDLATIGVPDDQPMDTSLELLGATASAHGCTIAAWSEHALFLSWDGGQSFAQLAMTGAFQVAVGAARAVIVRDRRELAVVRPGDRDLRWSVLPGIARRDAEGDAPADPDHMVARELVASGRWTVVTAGKLIMASDDDGASWRYLPLPAERFQLTTLDDEGRLAAIAIAPLHPRPTDDVSGAPEELETRRYELQVAGGTWRTLPALRGPLAAATRSWSYVHDSDEFWGCGGSTKIVAVRGGRQHVLAGNLRDEIYHVSLAANAEVAFAGFGENLHRLVGAREETVAAIPADDLRLAAVDAGGLPLALARSRLVRWSPRGGWRRLLPAIGADLGAPSSPNQ